MISFVSGSGYIEKFAMDGMRRSLVDEFTSIHVVNLRGDIRKNMLSKGRAKEGGNVFDSGSMTGIAITVLVKNQSSSLSGNKIIYHDIGDDLSSREKRDLLRSYSSINGIPTSRLCKVTPDQHGDWLNQRDDSANNFLPLGAKKGEKTVRLFETFSYGVNTARDAWCYQYSRSLLAKNIQKTIDFYTAEVDRFAQACKDLPEMERPELEKFIDTDPQKISWGVNLKQGILKGKSIQYNGEYIVQSSYRPYTKQWLYFNRQLNHSLYQIPSLFPQSTARNLLICISGIGARSGFSALVVNTPPNFHALDTGQCFPMYIYETAEDEGEIELESTGDLFAAKKTKPSTGNGHYARKDAITDEGLKHFQDAYPSEKISKEDLFYYVYGLLHSPDYRERYADNLSKELPRIPAVKTAKDFWYFSKAGRDLADLHLNYETVTPYSVKIEIAGKTALTDDDYRVEKMKYGKNGKDKDLTTMHYNNRITLTGIPLEAYDYVVNGKPALDWVVERQCVKTDKDSGIVNDANDWAIETMHNPKYPLELFMRVITVSLETMKIVNGLPKLDI